MNAPAAIHQRSRCTRVRKDCTCMSLRFSVSTPSWNTLRRCARRFRARCGRSAASPAKSRLERSSDAPWSPPRGGGKYRGTVTRVITGRRHDALRGQEKLYSLLLALCSPDCVIIRERHSEGNSIAINAHRARKIPLSCNFPRNEHSSRRRDVMAALD